MTLTFGRLWHIFNLRSPDTAVLHNEVTRNPHVGALEIGTLILLAAVFVPGLSNALGTTGLSLQSWGLVFGACLIPLVGGKLARCCLKENVSVQLR